ncbi:hypothetical protein ACVMIX_000579 [Rhizobium leguminosarum]
MGENVNQQVAGDGAVLVDADLQAGQRALRKQGGIAFEKELPASGLVVFRHGRCLYHRFAVSFDLGSQCGNRRLVRFVDLAIRPIELDAVAVRRNMRARDHQAAGASFKAIEGECGCGYIAAVEYPEAERSECIGAISRDFRARIAKIEADQNGIASFGPASSDQIFAERCGIKGGGMSL